MSNEPSSAFRRLLAFAVSASLCAALAAPGSADAARGLGTEQRQWVTEPAETPVAAERYEVEIVDDVWITMRDGTKLHARLLLPQGLDEVGPCVLMANGYGYDSEIGVRLEPGLRDLAERGYAAVHVSLRDSGQSEGTNALYDDYGSDGYDLVEWMADQPWCNGNVGMIGSSLLGISQWLTAKAAPPSLKAIIPNVACGDCYDVLWYPGGMLPGPGREARAVHGPEYEEAIKHRTYDDWWRHRTTIKEDHEAIARNGVAVMFTGGFYDYITPATIRAYEEFAAAGGDRMLIIGPWAHSVDPADVLPHHLWDYHAMWMDRFLRGIDNSIDEAPHALLYITGPNEWRFERDWPIPDARPVTYYLTADPSGTIDSLNDGSLSRTPPTDAEASVSYTYTPENGPFLPTMRDSSGGLPDDVDQSVYEAGALTWTSEPLPHAVEVSGTIKLSFWAEASGDTDFVAQLSDVAPDGSSRHVTVGYLNASLAEDRSVFNEPQPGELRRYEIELWPMPYVFDEGHRLRISLAGGSMALPDQNAPQGPGRNPNTADVTIHNDATHPATVTFPVVGTPPGESSDLASLAAIIRDEVGDWFTRAVLLNRIKLIEWQEATGQHEAAALSRRLLQRQLDVVLPWVRVDE